MRLFGGASSHARRHIEVVRVDLPRAVMAYERQVFSD
jgi:hypothetical protein